jgi:hypothetical protein
MRTKIDTSGVQFEVAATAKAKKDYRDQARQATTLDGRPVWTVRLIATDTVRETKETIWVEVAGDEPKLTFNGLAIVRELVYAPWVGKTDGKLRRAFKADAIEAAPGSKQSQHAA